MGDAAGELLELLGAPRHQLGVLVDDVVVMLQRAHGEEADDRGEQGAQQIEQDGDAPRAHVVVLDAQRQLARAVGVEVDLLADGVGGGVDGAGHAAGHFGPRLDVVERALDRLVDVRQPAVHLAPQRLLARVDLGLAEVALERRLDARAGREHFAAVGVGRLVLEADHGDVELGAARCACR